MSTPEQNYTTGRSKNTPLGVMQDLVLQVVWYRHFDLAAKFLLAEREKSVVDTKKAYLDEFVGEYKTRPRNRMPAFLKSSQNTLNHMRKVFTDKDPLLKQVGMVMIYYHLFRLAIEQGWAGEISRRKLLSFNRLREKNRKQAEIELSKAEYDLLEFDGLSQSPNDGYAVRFRLRILANRAFAKDFKTDDL